MKSQPSAVAFRAQCQNIRQLSRSKCCGDGAEVDEYLRTDGFRDVLHDPRRIANMDETAVRTVPTKEVMLAESGVPYVPARVGNSDKESCTALFAATADGILAPTLMLYPYISLMNGNWYSHER